MENPTWVFRKEAETKGMGMFLSPRKIKLKEKIK